VEKKKEKESKIGKKIKRILKNRGISYEMLGKRLGMTKQGVSWALNEREDEDWKQRDKEWWAKALKVEVEKIDGRE
jgi:transcriptional regulator with XRE-family HTH domain